jgi:hydrogenase nickel incorporation protein HypA/HybF
MALIDVYGARREVSTMLLPDAAQVGDYVLVHAGFAIQKISKAAVDSGVVMHEASIALSIIDIAVDSITVRIGRAAGIMPDSLMFAFDALKGPTPAKNAMLVVQAVPVGGRCNACGKEFETKDDPYVFSCPLCGSGSFELTKGREMEIVEMEMS